MEFSGQELATTTRAIAKKQFLELLVALSLEKEEKPLKWHAKPLSQYLGTTQGKTYELLREATKLGIVQHQKADVPTTTGKRRIGVFTIADQSFTFKLLQGGATELRISIGKDTPIRNLDTIRTLFSILTSKPFRISSQSIKSTFVYFTFKKLQQEWKRNNFPNLRGAWYAQVITPLADIHEEMQPFEKTNRPSKNAIVFREYGTKRRPPTYYRFRYSKVTLDIEKSSLPAQFTAEENGVVTTIGQSWGLFPDT